jgi:hypothetical protein
LQRLQEREAQDDKLECDPQNLQQWAARAKKLESELQSLGCELRRIKETAAQSQKLERELQTRLASAERQTEEIERLTLERDFYSKRVQTLKDHNRQLTEAATNTLYESRSWSASSPGLIPVVRPPADLTRSTNHSHTRAAYAKLALDYLLREIKGRTQYGRVQRPSADIFTVQP